MQDPKNTLARLYDDKSAEVGNLEGDWSDAMRSLSRLALTEFEDFSLDALQAVHEQLRGLSPKLAKAKADQAELRGRLL